MALTFYGASTADIITVTAADPTTADPNHKDLSPVTSGTLTAWTAMSGGTQITDLFAADPTTGAAGAAITAVTPTSLGRIMFWANNYSAAIWLEVSAGNRWRIYPGDLDSRVGGVASVNGKTGVAVLAGSDLVINAADIDDSTTVGRALLTATDAAAARTAIGASTGGGGTTGALLAANNFSDVADVPTAVQNLGGPFLQIALDTDIVVDGDVPTFNASTNAMEFRHPIDTGEAPYTLHGAVLNPGQAVPGDWPSDGIAFVRASAPVFSMAQIAQGGVQGNGATVTSNGLSQAVAVGDDVFISISAPAGGSVALIANIDDGSSGANVYTLRGQFLQGTSLQVANYKCRAAAALPSGRTITATLTNGNVLELEMTVHKITGLAASSYDQSGAGGAANVLNVTVTTGGATQYANEVAICSVATFGTNATTGAPPGFTQSGTTYSVNPAGATARFNSVFYKVLSATGTVSATPTRSPSGFLAVTLGTYKLA